RRIVLRPDGREQHVERRQPELQAERAIAIVGEKPVVPRFERKARGGEHRLVTRAADLKKDLALTFELNLLVVQPTRSEHAAVDAEKRVAIETVEHLRVATVQDGLHPRELYSHQPIADMLPDMSTQTVRLHRWDEIALEKVTEMLSRKVVTGEREMIAQ